MNFLRTLYSFIYLCILYDFYKLLKTSVKTSSYGDRKSTIFGPDDNL